MKTTKNGERISKPKNTTFPLTVTVNVTQVRDPKWNSESCFMKIVDCMGRVNDDSGKEIGTVGASIGAQIFVEIGGAEFVIAPLHFFEVVTDALKKNGKIV